jgi:2-polyprenyl-3-methyl-5-hydroxy-6-metoxy-1,4-benzoquinol methylase
LPGYYESTNYISHNNASKGLLEQAYRVARTFTLRWKYNIVRKYGKHNTRTILDFGCGTGAFLTHCRNKGLEVAGVEPAYAARQSAKELVAAPIAADIAEIQGTFDAITLWHVLEHVYDLNNTLEALKQRLNADGTMFVAVPNLESHDAQLYGEHWAAFDVPRHLWHFSQQTMARLLRNHNLKIHTILPMPIDAFYVSLLSEKYRNGEKGVPNMVNAFRQGMRSNRIAKKTGEYSSLIYIAHP